MPFDPRVHHRSSIRLKGYDYTQAGAYFVTLVVSHREYWLGNMHSDTVVLSEMGKMVKECWLKLPQTFNIQLDEWVIMPNHLHGIIVIEWKRTGEASARNIEHNIRNSRADASPQPNGTIHGSLGAIIQNYKSVSTRRVNQMRGTPGLPLWQRNYYERIIRDEGEWGRIRSYIQENQARWMDDLEFVNETNRT
jgi:REP-associated tyrosine transposase